MTFIHQSVDDYEALCMIFIQESVDVFSGYNVLYMTFKLDSGDVCLDCGFLSITFIYQSKNVCSDSNDHTNLWTCGQIVTSYMWVTFINQSGVHNVSPIPHGLSLQPMLKVQTGSRELH